MKYMNLKSVTETPQKFFLAKYLFIFILAGSLFVFILGLIEILFNFMEENWSAVEDLQRWFFFYIKGVFGGIVVWIFRGVANLIVDGILSGVGFAYKSTREDGKVILSFILKYLIVLGYPIFILWGKRIIFKAQATDFETKHFLQGYCTILYFIAIIFKAIWESNPLGKYLKLMKKLFNYNGLSQQ